MLDRTFAILGALAASHHDASLGELADQVKLQKSTVHRLVMTLEGHCMVERDPQTGRYHLGLRLFELGTIQRFRTRVSSSPGEGAGSGGIGGPRRAGAFTGIRISRLDPIIWCLTPSL